MDDLQELRIKCAKKMGWTEIVKEEVWTGDVVCRGINPINTFPILGHLPDYPNSMDACIELMERITDFELFREDDGRWGCGGRTPDGTLFLYGETPNEAIMRAYLEVEKPTDKTLGEMLAMVTDENKHELEE